MPTAFKKKPNIENKKPKSQTIFLTPAASKKSQICEIWRQKCHSGNPCWNQLFPFYAYGWKSLREIWLCRHNRAHHNGLGCLYDCSPRFTAFAVEQLRISTLNIWSTTVGSLHEFFFVKYKMKYFIQYFQIGGILIPSGYSREFCSENRKMKKLTNSREFSKPGSRFPNPNDWSAQALAVLATLPNSVAW